MPDKKIIFNITFHWQIEQLKFHLDNLFSWEISNNIEFVVVSAHKSNLNNIKNYCLENYPNKKTDFHFIPEDKGYHLGTIYNVVGGINYIKDNKDYDFIVNVEADNMFYSEQKFIKILNTMIQNEKELLLIEEGYGKSPHTAYPELNIPKYLHITTLNIFSKKFITENFPCEYYEEFMHFGSGGRPGTPFEVYIALSIMKKNNLTESNQMDFWDSKGLRLEYDRSKIYFNGWYFPDNLTPDRFVKWGIFNCFATCGEDNLIKERMNENGWNFIKKFVDLHKDLMNGAE